MVGQALLSPPEQSGLHRRHFTVNGKAYPLLHVKRRKYRLRFLGASIARCYELWLMKGQIGAFPGQQGQWNFVTQSGGTFVRSRRQQCARRRDLSANTMLMLDGCKPEFAGEAGYDEKYCVPMLKIVIGDDAPDNSIMPAHGAPLRPMPRYLPTAARKKAHFRLERGGGGDEGQWVINGLGFDPARPLHKVKLNSARDLDRRKRRRRLDTSDAHPSGRAPDAVAPQLEAVSS
jgi:hypothetical protein